MSRFLSIFSTSLCSFLLLTQVALAQVDRATLSGTITDPSGAVIEAAEVVIEAPSTGFRRSGQSSSVGIFRISGVPVGAYTMTVRKAGFASRRYTEVGLQVGQNRTVDVQLEVQASATEIEVVAGAAPLEQTNAEVGIVIGQSQIESLPLNGRNWTALLALAPGATNTGEGNQNTVRFNGRSRDENNFTFDGVDATGVKDPRQEANLRLNISLDSIAEFRVSSGLYSAESGNGAGAQMNLVSKTGSNVFHGGAFEYFRNDKLDARRPTDLLGKAPFRLNQFGGNLGGRILRDRTFFFANYEGLEQRLATTLTGSVPSAAFRQSASNASAALKPIIDAFKPGTSRTSNVDIDNLTSVASQPWTEKSGLLRVDHRFTDKVSVFARYNLDDGSINELRNALLETRTSNFRTQNGVVQMQYVLTPNLLSETRIGVNRSALHRDTNGTFAEGINIAGLINLQPNRSEVEIGTSFSGIENLTWTKGRHTFKFGGEYRYITLVLADTGQVTTAFSSRPNFLLNKADSVQFASALPGLKGLRPYYFTYAQDEVRLSKSLTLSLGTRYEYYSVAKTSDGRGRVLDLERCGGFCAAGTPWYFADKNNWAPRAGLAYAPESLKGKTVFRFGYGIFYGPGQIDDVNAAIDSYPETYALSSATQPLLSFPASNFVSQAKSTGISARALQRDRRDGYSQQWTVSAQQSLGAGWVGSAAYVGSNGHKLFGRSFINVLDANGKRPYPTFSNIDIKWNQGNSSMSSLQLSLLRAARRGVQWQTQYMWSHNISDSSGAGDGQNVMISNCRRCDRGDADWDIRHTLTTNATWAIPSPKAGLAKTVLGGWTSSGFFTARTGLPFNVSITRAATALPDGVTTTSGRAAPAQRPDFVPGVPLYTSPKNADMWLNIAAFRTPANGVWGNLPRTALRGPGLWQADFSLDRSAQLRENMKLEFRAELFNMFNRAQFGVPNANFSNSGTFGTITSVVNTTPTGSGGPRQIQLMLRLKF